MSQQTTITKRNNNTKQNKTKTTNTNKTTNKTTKNESTAYYNYKKGVQLQTPLKNKNK